MPVTDDAGLGEILRAARTIAVVGLSDDPARPSHGVALHLKANGFTIIPVNPNLIEALGERAVGSLADIEGHVDIVDVFRRPEHAPALAREAVSIGSGTFWLQLGIANDVAMRIAEAGGLYAVQNRCLRVEYQRLVGRGDRSGTSGRP
jgi:predicted CoA-binding protein